MGEPSSPPCRTSGWALPTPFQVTVVPTLIFWQRWASGMGLLKVTSVLDSAVLSVKFVQPLSALVPPELPPLEEPPPLEEVLLPLEEPPLLEPPPELEVVAPLELDELVSSSPESLEQAAIDITPPTRKKEARVKVSLFMRSA